MIIVTLNEDRYAYDIHSLVKAFYPEQEIKVFVKGTKEERSDAGLPAFFVEFDETSICAGIENGGTKTVNLKTPEDRGTVKNDLKQLLYALLSEETGKTLPWGTLTGIRPTKIAKQLLEQGQTEQEVAAYMEHTYLASKEKTELSIDIAKREMQILSGIHYEEGYSLYIGIPFCPTTCLYCSFTSFPICAWKNRVSDYLSAVEKEIDFVKGACADRVLDSVYIGGGTPTTLEPEELERLFLKLQNTLDWSQVREFTVEAGRADSITAEKLRVMKRYGVTRISVNPQTMKQETLDLIGRRHTVAQTVEAFRLAREEGFDDINMDLIAGLPADTPEGFRRTLDTCLTFGADNITVHTLSLKKGSRILLEGLPIPSAEDVAAMLDFADPALREKGFAPYYLYRQKYMSGSFENVGWCISGAEGLYNIYIMEELHSILSLGAGGSTKMVDAKRNRIERVFHPKFPLEYIQRPEKLTENLEAFRRFHQEMAR